MTNETTSATAPPAVREARPGDVVYSRGPGGHVLLGLVTAAGTLGRVEGQDPAHMIYLTAAWRPMDPRGVNSNVYEWQEKYEEARRRTTQVIGRKQPVDSGTR